jgi:hypothetical protein
VLVKMERGKRSFQYEGGFAGGAFDGEGKMVYAGGNSY